MRLAQFLYLNSSIVRKLTNIMKHNFKEYLNPVFIETGSFQGNGIRAAQKAGFEKIISIELSEMYYNYCVDKFKDCDNVTLYHGDSTELLPGILKDIDERCTFWIDAHYSGGETAMGRLPVPLMEELLIIRGHHRKDHTIIIDDMRLIRNPVEYWKTLIYGVADIERVIRSINPDYDISYGFGVVPNDILIAKI